MENNIVRFAMMKAVPKKWDLEYNMALFERMAKKAADNGAEILLTCECFLDGYCIAPEDEFDPTRFRDKIIQPKDGEYINRVKAVANPF